MLETNEKIRILLKRKNMTITQLAKKIGTQRQNLTNKLTRNNMTEKDIRAIVEALEMDLSITFKDRTTGEEL